MPLIEILEILIDAACAPRAGGNGARDAASRSRRPTALVEVPYEALTPRRNDTANLLVPLCASFSHVAFSTFRPVQPSLSNTKGYSSTYLAMVFAYVRAGTQKQRAVFGYLPEH